VREIRLGRQEEASVGVGVAREVKRRGLPIDHEVREADRREGGRLRGTAYEGRCALAHAPQGTGELEAQPLGGVADEVSVALIEAIFGDEHWKGGLANGTSTVMLEVAGTHFEKGVFELKLEEAPTGGLGRIRDIHPVKGRLAALAVLALAGVLVYFQLPAEFFVRTGIASDVFVALRMQSLVIWFGFVGLTLAFYAVLLGWRRERMEIAFDRHAGQVRVRSIPGFTLTPKREVTAPFNEVASLEVFSPERTPQTPHGFAEIKLPRLDPKFQSVRFRFLTDEQRQFFPLNLSKLLNVTPKGDWTDPDDEMKS